jgi:AcrR family transcriptional regulator
MGGMPRSAAQLPSGRRPATGLSKDEVTAIQRRRMLAAMADAVAAQGYLRTTVSDVVSRAGVSRATFYEQFTGKQDCFLAAFDQAVDLLVAALPAAGAGGDSGEGGVAAFSRFLAAYLDALAANPAQARVFLIEVYAAGPEAFRRRAASQQRFTRLVAAMLGARSSQAAFGCEALVAATGAMVTTRLAAGDLAGIRALHQPITELAKQLSR